MIIERDSVKVINGRNKARIISIINVKCDKVKEEIISPKNEPEPSDKKTKRCLEVPYQLKKDYELPAEAFSDELQGLEAKVQIYSKFK